MQNTIWNYYKNDYLIYKQIDNGNIKNPNILFENISISNINGGGLYIDDSNVPIFITDSTFYNITNDYSEGACIFVLKYTYSIIKNCNKILL